MAKRKRVHQLPEPVQDQLHQQLIQRGFAGYEELASWLKSIGYDISKSALHRYGQSFEDRLAALKLSTQQAQAVVAASPDTEGAMSDALIRLVQDRLFTVLVEVNPEQKGRIDLPKVARAVADLSRTTVNLRKYQAQVKERADAAAQAVAAMGNKSGLTPELVARIQQEIYGIAA